jgi:hypothetical protein
MKTINVGFFVRLFWGFLSLSLLNPPAQADDLVSGIHIEQSVKDVGKLSIYISNKGVKCSMPFGNVLFMAPKFDSYFYNDVNHLFVFYPYAEWTQNMALKEQMRVAHMVKDKTQYSQWQLTNRHDKIMGEDTVCYTRDQVAPQKCKYYCWVANAPKFKQAAILLHPTFLQMYDQVPPVQGIPLVATETFASNGHQFTVWQTSSIRDEKLDTTAYTFPSNYTRAKNEFEVMGSAIDDAMDGFGGLKHDMQFRPHP